MKKLALLLTLTCSILFAQEPITKNLGDFNTIKVFNGLMVELQKSSTSKVEITGKKSDDVSVKNSNGMDVYDDEMVPICSYWADGPLYLATRWR